MKTHKIVSVVASKRKAAQRTITLENGNVFRIPEDVFIKYRLYEGECLTEQELEKLTSELSLAAVREAALRLLSYRMRSRAELKNRLLKKGFQGERVETVIQNLEAKNYLNDEQFARMFAEEKVRNKIIGPLALERELYPHQLPEELLNSTLKKVYRKFPVKDLVVQNLKKRKIEKGTVLSEKDTKRLIQFLRRKGFRWDSIQSTLLEWGLVRSGNS